MKELTCTCGEKITGETEEEVMQKGAEHGREVHGFNSNDPTVQKMMEDLRRQIKDI